MRHFDVVALGELLIDFTQCGVSPAGSPLYECNPGGAPANVLTAVSRLGGSCAFIGKVGADAFGGMLADTLGSVGIDCSGLSFDADVRTTLAFVALDDTGNRSFTFFRSPGADIMLTPEEIPEDIVTGARFFHFGSLSLTNEPARGATRRAIEIAAEHGVRVSYDPNLRLPLWSCAEAARSTILEHMPFADIVKVSDEELEFLTGSTDLEHASLSLCDTHRIEYLFVTMGARGAYYRHGNHTGFLPTYDVPVVDTTGSGDAFMGAVLHRFCALPPNQFGRISEDALRDIVDFANCCGSTAASKHGGIPAMPDLDAIARSMRDIPLLIP